jgi:plasmid maintenance system antidote protein VapI
MATDPVVEYWAEIMNRTPVTPEVMVQWKRVLDHSLEAWSRALSEVMATDEFAQLLGTSIEHWLATQASFTGKPAPATGHPDQLAGLVAEMRRLDERLRHVEARVASSAEPTSDAVARAPRRGRRRRAA